MFFETIKVFDQRIFALPYHQKRLDHTREAHGLGGRLDLKAFVDGLELPAKGLYRLRLDYGLSFIGHTLVPYTKKSITDLVLVEKSTNFYPHKLQDRSTFLSDCASLGPSTEPIYLVNGYVTDTTYTALVFENSEGLWAPLDCLLPSTKLAALVDAQLVKKRRFTEADLWSFEKVHLVNAMLDLGDLCLPTSAIGRR